MLYLTVLDNLICKVRIEIKIKNLNFFYENWEEDGYENFLLLRPSRYLLEVGIGK